MSYILGHPLLARRDEDDELSVMEDKEEKEKKPRKCLEGSNGWK